MRLFHPNFGFVLALVGRKSYIHGISLDSSDFTSHQRNASIDSYIINHYIVIADHDDDVIKCKYFPSYWPFVRGIHRSRVDSRPLVTGEFSSQRPMTLSFNVSFDLRLNEQLRKQLRHWCLRCHCTHYDVTVIYNIQHRLLGKREIMFESSDPKTRHSF